MSVARLLYRAFVFGAVLAIAALGFAGVVSWHVTGYSTDATNALTSAFGYPNSFATPLARVVSSLVLALLFVALRKRRLILFLFSLFLVLVGAAQLYLWRTSSSGINFGGPSTVAIYVCVGPDGRYERSTSKIEPALGTNCAPIERTTAIVLAAQENPPARPFLPRGRDELLQTPRLSEMGTPSLLAGVAQPGQAVPALYIGRFPALDPQAPFGSHGLLHPVTNAELADIASALDAQDRARADEAKREVEQAAAREEREAAIRSANDVRVAAAQAEAQKAEEGRIEAERRLDEARVAAQPVLPEPSEHAEPAAPAAAASAPPSAPTPAPEAVPDEGAQSVQIVRDSCGRTWRPAFEGPPQTPCPVYVSAAPAVSYLTSMPPMPRRVFVPAVRFVAPPPWGRVPQQRMPYPMFRPPRRR